MPFSEKVAAYVETFCDKSIGGIIGLKCFFDESRGKNDEMGIMKDISKKVKERRVD